MIGVGSDRPINYVLVFCKKKKKRKDDITHVRNKKALFSDEIELNGVLS